MKFQSPFNQLANTPTLTNLLANLQQKIGLDLLCVRVGIVQTYYSNNQTADVLIVNKKTLGLNRDGSQVVRDWAKINAKVCFCSPYETFPINSGDECLLLFADREIESWFINGNTNPLAYSRMHDETDCIAIVGLRSLPKMIQAMTDCLNLFYGSSDIQIGDEEIKYNSAQHTFTGPLEADGIKDTTAVESGTFTSQDGKTITVKYGIITEITE